jgi:hypothetical protein
LDPNGATEEIPQAPNTQSKTHAPCPEELASTTTGQADESNNEEDRPDGESISDCDESLFEGESSYGDDPQFLGPRNLQRLVHFGQEHCRCPCRMKNKDGMKVASICGKKANYCQLHAKRRLGADSYQSTVGSHPPILAAHGFLGHYLASGPYYTDSQIQAFQVQEKKEMAHLVQTMNEDATDLGKMEELSRDLRMRFKSPKAHSRKPQFKTTDNLDTPDDTD